MENKILIVYYTHSGNTEKIAELIADKTGGHILKIEPENVYPKTYALVVAQAKVEISKGYYPKLKTEIPSLDKYDTIFVGTPNWWSTIAPPIKTFLTENDLSGKKIIPFYTHGGGGAGHIIRDIKELCPASEVLNDLGLYNDGGSKAEEEVSQWIEKLGL